MLQTANEQLDKAQKDLTPLVTLARTNLEKFGEQTKAELERLSEASANVDGVMIGADGTPILTAAPRMDKGKGVDRTQDETPTSPNPNSGNPTAAASAFFAKIQAQITSNSNVQELSKNLVTLQSNVTTNLSHIPTSFQTNLSQLQAQLAHIDLGESQKLAEDYVHKGEAWLAEFSTEIGRLAKDAVKVVPPSAEEMDRTKIREARLRQAEQVAVGRKDTMIQRLREDPAVLLVDPAQPPSPSSDGTSTRLDTRESFARFLQSIEDGGGLEGEVFEKRISDELSAAGEGEKSLTSSLRATVGTAPSQLTREAFWSRYFFRVGQIEDEEQRRKQVLEGECERRSSHVLTLFQWPPLRMTRSAGTWRTKTRRRLPCSAAHQSLLLLLRSSLSRLPIHPRRLPALALAPPLATPTENHPSLTPLPPNPPQRSLLSKPPRPLQRRSSGPHQRAKQPAPHQQARGLALTG